MEMLTKLGRAVAVLSLVAAVLGGCGSDSTRSLVDISGTARLTSSDPVDVDGFRYKLVQFRATQDGVVRVTMERTGSTPVADPWVEAWYGRTEIPDQYSFIGYDDDSGGCYDAMLMFAVERNAWYTVMFTTYEPGDLGSYRYNIRELLCDPAAAQVTAPPPCPGKEGAAPRRRAP